MRSAPNFSTGTPGATPLYPLPQISHFTTRSIHVQTSLGARAATEITIHGTHFAIRGTDPEVVVNGIPLVHFHISNDFQTISGYFFATLSAPVYSVIVDYGGGVRGEWSGSAGVGGAIGGNRHARLLKILLLILLLLLLAMVVLAGGGFSITVVGWVFLIGAIIVDIIALLAVWNP